ncbi:MAG: S8 family serine peptidase [Planctomycetota bacterium]
MVALLVASFLSASAAARDDLVSAELRSAMDTAAAGEQVQAYLVMEDQLTQRALAPVTRGLNGRAQRKAVADALKAHAALTQAAARNVLAEAVADGSASDVQVLWMGNAIIFSAVPSVIEHLARLPGIDRVRIVAVYDASEVQDEGSGTADGGPPAPVEPNITNLQAEMLWETGFNGQGVMIGNIDSGVWWQHPDLINRIWTNPDEIDGNGRDDDNNGLIDDIHGWDYGSDGPDISSFDSHGTKTSGIAVGDGSSGERATGMAPGATLLGFKMGTEADYWLAQQYCLDKGVDVITSSYSYKWAFSPKPDYHMHRQVCEMELAGGIIHANSIGNQGLSTSSYPIPFNIATPGNCPSPFDHPDQVDGGRSSVMGCGGILIASDTLYNSSGRGPAAWEDITLYNGSYPWTQDPAYWDYPYGGFGGGQPGLIKPDVMGYTEGVWTTTVGTGYSTFGGTSAATPHLGGAMCLMRSVQPEAAPRHVAAALEFTAIDMGPVGKDSTYGSGLLRVFDAGRRLRILGRADTQTPSMGTSFDIDLFGYANATVYGWFGLTMFDAHGSFNLASPFFDLGPTPLDATGHAVLPLTIPVDPILLDLTIWFQFGASVDSVPTWGPGPLLSVPESITIGA